MASGVRYVCGACGKAIEAWDDGNPYYIDNDGNKRYAYHPASERDRCVGNDSPHLCLGCGLEFMVDSEAPTEICLGCASPDIVDTWHLAGRRCPSCKNGVFAVDPDYHVIS